MSASEMLDGSLYDEVDDLLDATGLSLVVGVMWALIFEAACVAAVFASVVLWRWTH